MNNKIIRCPISGCFRDCANQHSLNGHLRMKHKIIILNGEMKNIAPKDIPMVKPNPPRTDEEFLLDLDHKVAVVFDKYLNLDDNNSLKVLMAMRELSLLIGKAYLSGLLNWPL